MRRFTWSLIATMLLFIALTPSVRADDPLPQVRVITDADFHKTLAETYPASANLSSGGKAVAVPANEEADDATNTLGSIRLHDIWFLKGNKGYYQALWTKPIIGQYVLFFGRRSKPKNDQWGNAVVKIATLPPIPITGMGPQKVLIIDLKKTVAIDTIRVEWDGTGTTNPGFCGLEIFGPVTPAASSATPAAPVAPIIPIPAAPRDPNTVLFSPLWPDHPSASCLACTDDGKRLLVSFPEENLIRVFDLQTWKDVCTLSCPTPKYILCRAGRAFVASYGQGKIEVYNCATWKLTDEFLTGTPEVDYLSAPLGDAFKNWLFAAHHPAAPEARSTAVLVNLADDTHKDLGGQFLLTASSNGAIVNEQRSFNSRPHSNRVSKWDEATASIGGALLDAQSNDDALTFQARPSLYWYGDDTLYSIEDRKFKPLRPALGKLVIPDSTRGIFYALDDLELTAYAENPSVDLLATRPVQYRQPSGSASPAWPASARRKKNKFDVPVAVTLGPTTFLFYANTQGTVMAAQMPAVPFQSLIASNQPADSAALFPSTLTAGQDFRVKLSPAPGTILTLMDRTGNMAITTDSVFIWDPTNAEVGDHIIKIRIEHAGVTSFERHTVTVTSASDTSEETPAPRGTHHAAPPAEANPAPAPVGLSLPAGDYELVPCISTAAQGELLAGDQLLMVDPSAQKITATHALPRTYLRLAERNGYYVALSNNTLDLLNKTTFQLTQSIPLGTSQTYDMVLRPGGRQTYVALYDDDGGRIDKEIAKRVCVINENTGKITRLNGVVGQWLAINPAGTRLFAGLHFLYENGLVLDFNMGDIRPDYGDVDMLSAFNLNPLGLSASQQGRLNFNPGVNGRCLRIAPDGASVAYVSAAGNPVYSYSVSAFDPADPTRTLVSYSMKGLGFPADIAFHRNLPIVAVITGEHVVLFDRSTGEPLAQKIELPPHLSDLKRCFFSPDGAALVLDAGPKEDRRLISLPLPLTDQQRAQIKAPLPPAPEKTPQDSDDKAPLQRL